MMQPAIRLTVHPGLGKTATTTVQAALRDRSDLWYGGVRSHPSDHPFTRAFDALFREPLDRWTWRATIPLADRIDTLAQVIADGLAGSNTGVGILSDEAILGHVGDDVGWRGPYMARRGRGTPGSRLADERLRRLSSVLERTRSLLQQHGLTLEVRGLLTIRRHGPLLGSSWAWNVEHYRGMGVRNAEDLLRLVVEDRLPRLRFSRLCETMQRSGLAPVSVLPLEALARDPDAFWDVLTELVGAPLSGPPGPSVRNQRSPAAGEWVARTVANRTVARLGTSATLDALLAPLPTGIRQRIEHVLRPRSTDGVTLRIDPQMLADIDSAYAADTALLAPYCPFDLRMLDYPVAGYLDPVA
jgi:hypothetical protein